jgi:hypothetical protein
MPSRAHHGLFKRLLVPILSNNFKQVFEAPTPRKLARYLWARTGTLLPNAQDKLIPESIDLLPCIFPLSGEPKCNGIVITLPPPKEPSEAHFIMAVEIPGKEIPRIFAIEQLEMPNPANMVGIAIEMSMVDRKHFAYLPALSRDDCASLVNAIIARNAEPISHRVMSQEEIDFGFQLLRKGSGFLFDYAISDLSAWPD